MSTPDIGTWIRRAKAAPTRVEHQIALLEELRELLHRDLHLDASSNSHLHSLLHEVGRVLESTLQAERAATAVDASLTPGLRRLAGRLEVVHRHIEAPRRDAALSALLDELGPPAPLEDGLSVLIPAWNHATRLGRTLDRALEVVAPERVIVLDDASTDETPLLLAERTGIRVLRPERNLGLTRARNALFHAATTTRALNLDADNEIDPGAIGLLDSLSARWEAAATHGVVLEVDADGRAGALVSAEPLAGAAFRRPHNTVDSLAVLDVAAVRAVHGYTLDPALETSEDWDMWHRLARARGLLLFVPTVVARKLRAPTSHNAQPQDHSQQLDIVARTYRFDGRLDDTTVASAVVHPATGPLWASDAALALRPELGEHLGERYGAGRIPAAAKVQPAPASVLVAGSGGVRNLGDDATVEATIRRLRDLVGPEVGIELVTDGDRPSGDLWPAVWLGTVREFANRPLDHHLAVVIAGGGTLGDQFPEHTAGRHALAAQAARMAVPVLMTGQGIGPHSGGPSALPALLDLVVAMTVRDPLSADLARRLGARDVTVVGDDAAVPVGDPERPALLEHVDPAGWLALNGRLAGYSGADKEGLLAWARAVDEAAAELGVDVVAVAQNRQEPPEVALMAELAGRSRHAPWHVVDLTDDITGARAAYGMARGVVTRSYHAAWFALSEGTATLLPAEGEYYELKAEGLRQLAGIDTADFAEPRPPGSGAELLARLEQVRPDRAALTGVDARATAWLAEQLVRLGVPTR